MKFLLDTHVLLWASYDFQRLSTNTLDLLADRNNEIYFSVVSIWEATIKRGQKRTDFQIDVDSFREGMLRMKYLELEIKSRHARAVETLHTLHRDPFDRLLIAQSLVEGMTLLTVDKKVLKYSGNIRKA